jgi:FkbM family methyltransferase
MDKFASRVRSFLTHKSVRHWYVRWLVARALGTQPFVDLPGGARGYATARFNDFHGIAVQHPDDAELRSFTALLGDGGLYVDVGANMGLTCVVAAQTGKAARIIGFEPTHAYAEVWHRNILANSVRNATLLQCGVGATVGTMPFLVNPDAPMHNRLHIGEAHARYEKLGTTATHLQTVAMTTLDAVCDSLGVSQIDLLKIDVEGAEPAVLQGAAHLLTRKAIKAVYCEFIPEFMTEMGWDVRKHIDWIYSLGYTARRIEPDGSIGAPMRPEELAARQFQGLNVVLMPA